MPPPHAMLQLIDQEEFVQTEDDVARCALKLLESELYQKHSEYVRLQLIHGLLQVR